MNIEEELRKNVKDLQDQLSRAYQRIKTLKDEIDYLRNKISPEASFSYSGMSGWALMSDVPSYETDKEEDKEDDKV